MQVKSAKVLTLSLLVLVGAVATRAAAFPLGVGDKAPTLHIEEWVKGGQVSFPADFSKRVHLVEFWATWCGPCKISIPTLTELQKRHANDLTVVGVTDPDPRNTHKDIRKFVTGQGDGMGYTVAIDKTSKTWDAYMTAAGAMGIPHAFLVDKSGTIVWQGSPLDPAIGEVISQVIAGKYDITAAKLQMEVDQRFQTIYMQFQMRQWESARQGLLGILEVDPANETAMRLMIKMRMDGLLTLDEFIAWGDAHVSKHGNNATSMARLVEGLCDNYDFTTRVPELAFKAAKAGYEGSQGKDADAAAAYARAVYLIGDLDKAIELQQKAIANAGESTRKRHEQLLEYYQTCKAIRTREAS